MAPTNFLVPVIVYFKSIQFRRGYNQSRDLTVKQIFLLLKIHHHSNKISGYLARQLETIVYDQSSREVIGGISDHTFAKEGMSENHTQSLNVYGGVAKTDEVLWRLEDVPDPDMEDFIAYPLSNFFPSRKETFTGIIAHTIKRKITNESKSDLSQDTEGKEIPMISVCTEISGSLSRNSFYQDDLISELHSPLHLDIPKSTFLSSPSSILDSTSSNPDGIYTLARLSTLPSHPQFKSPAFRSIPKWLARFGLRTGQIAITVFCVTASVIVSNIILMIMP